MSLSPQKVAANAVFFATALTIQKILSFLYFSYLARSLGTVLTGKYFFALSMAGVVIAVMDIGFTPVLTREVAKDKEIASAYVSQIFSIKLLLALIVAIASAFLVPLITSDVLLQQLIFIALAIAMLDTFALTFFATIRAHQNLSYESISAIVFQCIVIAFGGIAVYRHADLKLIIGALFLASLFNMLFSLYILRRRVRIPVRIQFDPKLIKRIIKFAIPFALAAAFIKVYAYIDIVLLKFLVGDHAVGLYSVPYKITFAFQFVPLALVATLYPAFSYYWKNDTTQLRATFLKSLEYLLIVSLPIAAGIATLAPQLISSVYTSAYAGSIVPLMILIVSLPFLFLNFPIGSLLNASSRQNRQTAHLGITMAVNVALNLVLIPLWGVVGAAVASTASTVLIFILGLVVAYQIAHFEISALVVVATKTVAITTFMVLLILLINQHLPWYSTILPASLFYLFALYAARLVSVRDVKQLIAMVRR